MGSDAARASRDGRERLGGAGRSRIHRDRELAGDPAVGEALQQDGVINGTAWQILPVGDGLGQRDTGGLEFCEACGAQPGKIKKMVADSMNQRVKITVQQRVSDKGRPFSEITGFALAD